MHGFRGLNSDEFMLAEDAILVLASVGFFKNMVPELMEEVINSIASRDSEDTQTKIADAVAIRNYLLGMQAEADSIVAARESYNQGDQ